MNKNLIEKYKYLHKQTTLITPAIYASIAMALHSQGWGYKRINALFCQSQKIWEDNTSNVAGMVKKCEEETGIQLADPKFIKEIERYNRQ